jgi:tetratricopeptide (TPR) repeat protein
MKTKIVFLAACLFFISNISSSQNKKADSLFVSCQEHNKKGMELIKSGDKKSGLKELYKAVEDFRDYDYEMMEKRDSIKVIIKNLLDSFPESPVYNIAYANMIMSTQRDSAGFAKAKEYYEKSINIEPKFRTGYSALGSLASLQGDSEEAIKQYNKAIKIDSTYYQAYYRLASIYKRAEMFDKANVYWQKIIKADSTSEYSVWSLLDIADTKKTFDEKYSIYKTALHLNNDMKEVVYGRMVFLLGNVKEAPDSAETMLRKIIGGEGGKIRNTKQTGLLKLFEIIRRKDKNRILEYAEEIYNEPNPVILLTAGSFIADSLNNIPLGLKYLEKAYEITSPESVYETVAFGRYNLKYLQGAAEQTKYGWVGAILGEEYYKEKNYEKALKYLLESALVNEKKKNPQSHYRLGDVYNELGKKDEAVKWYVKGLVIKDDAKARKKLEKLVAELNKDMTDESSISKAAEKLLRNERMKSATPAQDFVLPTLNNGKVSLSSLIGKVVILDFWATWCGPCIMELPKLVKLYEKYSANPNVVFYNIDVDEQPKVVQDFMNKKGYSFSVLMASGTDVSKKYEVTAIPVKFLVDKKGRIQYKHIGSTPQEDVVEQLSKEIDELLELEN